MVERYTRFAAAVSKISNCIQKIESEAMAGYGLKGSCAQYITAIRLSQNGMTISQLSETCMKDKAAVSRTIAELEAKGVVIRKAQGSNIYRAPLVLTVKGQEIAGYVAQRAAAAVKIAGLDGEERHNMYMGLDVIAQNLSDICKEGMAE